MSIKKSVTNTFLLTSAMAVAVFFTGCDRKKTVVDVDTPNGGVSIDRNLTDGGIEVDVDDDE